MGLVFQSQDLASRVRLEIEDSSKHNEDIAAKWTVVTALEVPQELARQILNQRKVGPFLLCLNLLITQSTRICSMLTASSTANKVREPLTTIIRSVRFRFAVCCAFLISICVQEIFDNFYSWESFD